MYEMEVTWLDFMNADQWRGDEYLLCDYYFIVQEVQKLPRTFHGTLTHT